MIRNLFIISIIWLSHINAVYALSVTPSVANVGCDTTTITFTFKETISDTICDFNGFVTVTSSAPPSVSFSIGTGLQNVASGVITFDVIVNPSNTPGSFLVNFEVKTSSDNMCAPVGQFATTTINYNCLPPPANDDCSGAIPLTIATNSCNVSSYSTQSGSPPIVTPTGQLCSIFPAPGDLWYSFIANNTTVTMEINSFPGIAGNYALYDGTGSCGSLGTEIECGFLSVPAMHDFTGLTVNSQYYIQILYNSGVLGDQEICLHSTTPQPTCPDMVMLTGTETGTVDTESIDWIKSDQILMPSSVIDYDAVDSIVLLPNFEVKLGSMFHAFIDGCGGSMLKEEEQVEIKK